MLQFWSAFGLTMLVEVPLYTLALSVGWRISWPYALTAAILVNAVTHPLLWWFLADRPGHYFAAEAAVCVSEWLMMMALLRRRDGVLLLLSLAVNGASMLAGLIFLSAA